MIWLITGLWLKKLIYEHVKISLINLACVVLSYYELKYILYKYKCIQYEIYGLIMLNKICF